MGILSRLFHTDDRVCPWWLAYTFDNPFRRFLHDPEKLLSPHVREGMTVADIGCGMGYFSIAMAKMVGRAGSVVSVDLQQEMLRVLRMRAQKAGVLDRIRFVHAAGDDIRVAGRVDFVLAFWMVHEAGDAPRFFSQVSAILAPGGKVLLAEPKMHVPARRFREILDYAQRAGFRIGEAPPVRISRAVILVKT
jgi:ubiquinone/menaquinone biosynthesis C-methylase UbiE